MKRTKSEFEPANYDAFAQYKDEDNVGDAFDPDPEYLPPIRQLVSVQDELAAMDAAVKPLPAWMPVAKRALAAEAAVARLHFRAFARFARMTGSLTGKPNKAAWARLRQARLTFEAAAKAARKAGVYSN